MTLKLENPADLLKFMAGLNNDRLAFWASGFRGLSDIKAMASPPTVTRTESTASAINSSNNAASLPARGRYTDFQIGNVNTQFVSNSNPNNNRVYGRAAANTDGSVVNSTLMVARGIVTVPDFEVVCSDDTGNRINAVIDGEYVSLVDGRIPVGGNSGNTRYLRFNLGADATTYGLAKADVPAGGGGTGNAINEILTAVGGTFTRPAKVRIVNAPGGVASSYAIVDPGEYSVLPSNPVSTTSSGSGSGALILATFNFPIHSTYKARQIELLFEGCGFYGINYTPIGTEPAVIPWRRNPLAPRGYWLGDSQDSPTYAIAAGATASYLAARRMGLHENLIIDGRGGTGWGKPSGVSPAFESDLRLNALIANDPDYVIAPYSQNIPKIADGEVPSGYTEQSYSLERASYGINRIMNECPRTRVVLLPPAFGAQSWHRDNMLAVVAAAPDPSRIRMLDGIGEGWSTGNYAGFLTNDATHWGVWGNWEWRSEVLASQIAWALCDMVQ